MWYVVFSWSMSRTEGFCRSIAAKAVVSGLLSKAPRTATWGELLALETVGTAALVVAAKETVLVSSGPITTAGAVTVVVI